MIPYSQDETNRIEAIKAKQKSEAIVRKGFWAEVILDSVGPQGNRLTTMEFTIPKLWLAEFNTHCMFARNSASTRAIPFAKQVAMMDADTFVPEVWPLENPGMAARNNLVDPAGLQIAHNIWEDAMISSRDKAKRLTQLGIHKQLSGRLLEPWRFQTVLVTGDEASYSNFFYLRRDKGAAPEIQAAANKMYAVYKDSKPRPLRAGEWHMPLLLEEDYSTPFRVRVGENNYRYDTHGTNSEGLIMLRRVSAARCARLSYLTHHGVRDIKEDIGLFSRLTSNGHWSPLEHVCRALPVPGVLRSLALRFLDAVESGHGKWPGWHQYRKDFPREYITGYLKEANVD